MCGPHRAGKARSTASRAKRAAEYEANLKVSRIERAQTVFVRQWRAEHPEKVNEDGWVCPLCNVVIQQWSPTTLPVAYLIEVHQNDHAGDWLAYAAFAEGE